MKKRKYRVFISSVQKELEIERVSVAGEVSSDNILNAFCNIVLFEKEPLSGKRVAKPYLKCLESCDVYVLILDRQYGNKTSGISVIHEEYCFAQKNDMPMLIFIRGRHDDERHKNTQQFFSEIKKDGHTYRRFHDRQDLIPELKRSLRHILCDTFNVQIEQLRRIDKKTADNISVFEKQELNVSSKGIDIDVARQWLQIKSTSCANIMNHLREKGLVRRNDKGSEFSAMASGLLFLGKNPSQGNMERAGNKRGYCTGEADHINTDAEVIKLAADLYRGCQAEEFRPFGLWLGQHLKFPFFKVNICMPLNTHVGSIHKNGAFLHDSILHAKACHQTVDD